MRIGGLLLLLGVSFTALNAELVRLAVTGAPHDELRSATVVRWQSGVPHRALFDVMRDAAGVRLDVDATCDAHTTFIVATTTRIGAASCSSKLVALQPRASIRARFTAPGVSGLPPFGVARTKCGATSVDIPFAFEPAKPVDISVPASCGVVSIEVARLAPLLIPPESLSTAKPYLLGDVALRHGASLLARVRAAAEDEPLPELDARVLRWSDLESLRGAFDEEALRPLATGVTDAHGWVSFYAISPADVVLALKRAKQRFPEITQRYLLDAGRGLVLDDLELSAPATVAVRLDVPEKLADQLVLTNVQFSPARENRWPERARIIVPAVTDGTPSAVELPAGAWSVEAAVRVKDGFVTSSASQRLALLPGSFHEVALQVNGGVFRGRVVRGTGGVRGVVNLSRASDARQATARTNDEGRFTILLDGPGKYSVQFDQPLTGSVRFDNSVEFTDPSDEVEIRLPEGRVRGSVVDERGVPMAHAEVSAYLRSSANGGAAMEAYARSAADGTFTIESLGGGVWSVRAGAKGVEGTAVDVALAAAGTVDGIVLKVRDAMEVGFHLVDARGVAVANAWLFIETPNDPQVSARTNADGVARAAVPRAAVGSIVNVFVSTTDDRLAASLVRIESQRVVTVRLPAVAGEVRLKRKNGTWPEVSFARLVNDDGASIPVPTRRGKAMVADDLIRLSRVPAGRWRYIEAKNANDVASIRALRYVAVQPAAEFVVKPGVVNEVNIP